MNEWLWSAISVVCAIGSSIAMVFSLRAQYAAWQTTKDLYADLERRRRLADPDPVEEQTVDERFNS